MTMLTTGQKYLFQAIAKKVYTKKSTWENSKVIMALERPLALKYTDKIVADQIKNQALVDKTAMEKIREQFLEGL